MQPVGGKNGVNGGDCGMKKGEQVERWSREEGSLELSVEQQMNEPSARKGARGREAATHT